MGIRAAYYEGWEERITRHLADIFQSNLGTPKVLDARLVLSKYSPVQIDYARLRFAQGHNRL